MSDSPAPSCYLSLDVMRTLCPGTELCLTITCTLARPISGWPRSTSAEASKRRLSSTTPACWSCGGIPTRRFSRWCSRHGTRWLASIDKKPAAVAVGVAPPGLWTVRRGIQPRTSHPPTEMHEGRNSATAKSLPSFIVRAPSSGLLLDVHYDDFGGTLPAHPQEPLDLRASGFGEMRSTAD